MKKTFILLPFAILLFAMALPLAKAECVAPPDPGCSQCSGLPSGYISGDNPNNFKYETCLDTCQNDNILLQIRYENCVFREQQQAPTNTQTQSPAQNNSYSEPATVTNGNQNPDNLKDEIYTVKDLKTGSYVKSKSGQRLTVPVPEGNIVLDETSTIQKLKDGWKVVTGKTKFIYNKIKKGPIERLYKVTSSNAVVSVRGTTFFVEVDKKNKSKTTVRVIEGVVEVTDNRKKNKVQVKAGTQTVVNKGKKPSNPTSFDPGSLDQWFANNPNESK